jgi:arginine/ornithine N-succinyltransferase beta subunit
LKATVGEGDAEKSRPYLIGVTGPNSFRAVQATATVEGRRIMLGADILKALAVHEGVALDVLPLP